MELLKDLKDIKFPYGIDPDFGGEVSESIVMRSNAGWYIGSICRPEPTEPDWIEPYDKETGYMTKEEAIQILSTMEN
jgi:hypothetical protein